jgi:hypothetical protein
MPIKTGYKVSAIGTAQPKVAGVFFSGIKKPGVLLPGFFAC